MSFEQAWDLMTSTHQQSRPSPFDMRENWTQFGWERVVAAADRVGPRDIARVLSALRELFPPELVPMLIRMNHPAVRQQATVAGRYWLLELGLAMVCLGVTRQAIERLRTAEEYAGVAAELRAELFFHRAGAQLERPKGAESHEFTPRFRTGRRLAVEVKHPDESEWSLDTTRVEAELLFELIPRLTSLLSDQGPMRAILGLSPSILELGDRHGVDELALKALVAEALENAKSGLGPAPRNIALARLGSMELKEDASSKQVQFQVSGPQPDPRKVFGRVKRNLLKKAVEQIEKTRLPGLIMIDVQRDSLLRNTFGLLHRWAQSKSSLAAIVVIDRDVMASDHKMYGRVHVIPGPLFDQAEDMFAAFDSCGSEHLHYNPLCTPSDPCPLRR